MVKEYNLKMRKKAMLLGPIVKAVVAILFVVLAGNYVIRPGYNYVRVHLFNESGVAPPKEIKTGFEPYEHIRTEEEETVVDSMTALVAAINAVAKGEDVFNYSKGFVDAGTLPFDSYEIAFSGRIELEEDGANDMRDWAFSRRFNVKDKVSKQDGHKIRANYFYGSCGPGDSGVWKECIGRREECLCFDKRFQGDGEDDMNDAYGEMEDYEVQEELITKAKERKLAPIREIQYAYNIELTTYKDGKQICRISTADGNLTDTDKKDLLTWGSLQSYPEEGADRDGDGIKGMYPREDWGRKLTELEKAEIRRGSRNDEAYQQKLAIYFPDGKIKERWDNGELCLDSPTWLECKGIRVYYCGKYYRKYGAAGDKSLYYFELNRSGNVHSRAGIAVTRIIDEEFTQEQSSANRKDDEDNLEIRDSQGHTSKVASSWWEFAKEYDADVILRTIMVAGAFATGPVGGLLALKATEGLEAEMDDPALFCEGGSDFGKTTVKCDESGCGICNFNLPQNVTKDYDDALAWFNAYGDPRYVIYSGAFPTGEEEAWILDPLDVSLKTILIVDASVATLQVFGKSLKMMAKIVDTVVTGGVITRLVRVIGATARGVKGLLMGGVDRVSRRVLSPKTYIKIFSSSTSILRYVSDDALVKIGTNADEVAKSLMGDKQLAEVVEAVLKESKIISRKEVFMKALPRAAAKKGAKYGLYYAAAVASAREDSMNEKFYPIGANAIGYKKPYDRVFKTGFGLPELDSGAGKYYIQLTKDKYVGGWVKRLLLEQNGQRFFLASPCLANLAIVRSKCKCHDVVDENVAKAEKFVSEDDYKLLKKADTNGNNIIDANELFNVNTNPNIKAAFDKYANLTGKRFYYPAGEKLTTHDFGGGEIPIYVDSIDETKSGEAAYADAVKTCKDRSANLFPNWKKVTYETECIIVNPVLIGDTFCYSGSHTIATIGKVATFAGVIAASIALEAGTKALMATGIGAPLGFALSFGGNVAIDIVGALIENELTEATKWPNH